MASNLTRIGERARKEPKCCFTSLYHHVTDRDNLRACFERMEPGKAPGIDGVTKAEYAKDLEGNLKDLSAHLGRLAYRPQPVRRQYIPKVGSNKKRPLGIPCLEDKMVQLAIMAVLEQIYEADFLDCSHGYRPGRTPHQVVGELGRTLQQQPVSFVAEADIQGFFDHVNHEWLMKFLKIRIGDERLLRLIWRMLKAGVMEDGLIKVSRRFKKLCRGGAYLFRFADDFVGCFQYRWEAEGFLKALKERLEKFHLQVEPDKTKLMEFGRFADGWAQRQGRKPEEFDFLGFTHYCGCTRKGHFKVKRRTSNKKYRAKLKELHLWMRNHRHRIRGGEMLRQTKVRLVGHLNYYAITDNGRKCRSFRPFRRRVERMLYFWLNRRGQRRSYCWQRFTDALAWVEWPSARLVHQLSPYAKVSASNGC